MKSIHWQQKEPEITKMKCGTPVMEDLLVLAGRSCSSGQGQELLGAVLPQLKKQGKPRTKSYQFFSSNETHRHNSTVNPHTVNRNTCINLVALKKISDKASPRTSKNI